MVGGSAIALAPGAVAAEPTATRSTGAQATNAVGTVTEAVPGPGRLSAQGPPVAGVLVSNGRDVVRTDSQGRYRLPVASGQTIFVVKPAGVPSGSWT